MTWPANFPRAMLVYFIFYMQNPTCELFNIYDWLSFCNRLVTLILIMVVGTDLKTWPRRGHLLRLIHLFQGQMLQLKLQQLWLQHLWCLNPTPHIRARCLGMLKSCLRLPTNIEVYIVKVSLKLPHITTQQDMEMSSCGQLVGSIMQREINHIFNTWPGKMVNSLLNGEVRHGSVGITNLQERRYVSFFPSNWK